MFIKSFEKIAVFTPSVIGAVVGSKVAQKIHENASNKPKKKKEKEKYTRHGARAVLVGALTGFSLGQHTRFHASFKRGEKLIRPMYKNPKGFEGKIKLPASAYKTYKIKHPNSKRRKKNILFVDFDKE